MNSQDVTALLDTCYDKVLTGLPVGDTVEEIARQYLYKYESPKKAALKMCDAQIVKCGTSGFLTGLGGLITLPIAIPANLASVLYVQLRMVACIAHIGGWDAADDEVKTLAYVCLTGSAASDLLKQTGAIIGEKISINLIKKIPGKALISINKKVGFRLLTKFGEKGIVNFAKLLPIVGGVVGSGFDIASTKIIASNAIKIFIDGKFD